MSIDETRSRWFPVGLKQQYMPDNGVGATQMSTMCEPNELPEEFGAHAICENILDQGYHQRYQCDCPCHWEEHL